MTKNAGLWPGWEVTRQIGQGGFGKVYEIRREIFGDEERAALKVITIPRGEDEVDYLRGSGLDEHSISQTMRRQVESIAEEYKIMVKMRECVNVVHCDDVRFLPHKDGIGWDILIKMELLTPLLKVLDLVQTQEQILQLGKDLCHALMACRKHNIIHRDIKPQNVFRSDEGNFKLGDFGIARTMEQTGRATAGIGTYSFMAPEVMKNEPYGKTADIYSLGLLLYWLLNERRAPFMPLPPVVPRPGEEEQSRNRRLSGEKLPAPKNGTDALKAVVLKACAYRPADRWQTGEEFLHALEALTDGEIEKPIRQPRRTEQAPEIRQEWDTPWRPTGAPYGEQTTARGEDDMEETACGVLQLPKSDLQPQRPRERTGTQPRRPKPKRKSRRMLPTVVLLTVALLLIAGLCAIGICAANCTSGGSDLHWEINGHTGQLTIYDQVGMETGEWYDYGDMIESVIIKDGVVSIRDNAFAEWSTLTSVEIPDSVTAIGEYAFLGTGLTSVELSDGVISIEEGAFARSYLASVEIPSGITSIETGVFANTCLTSVTIPDSVTYIGEEAFAGCSDLTSVEIPDSVTYIEAMAFEYTGLASVEIPDSVTHIGGEAFASTRLTSMVIPDGVTTIGYRTFAFCENLTSVTIPDSVTYIGEEAFCDCTGLTSVTIPDSVTSIGGYAFAYCERLTSVEIPDSVTYIEESAFSNCTDLTDVYYSGTSEQWEEIFIGDFNEELTTANIHATDGVIVAETQDDETEEDTDTSDSAWFFDDNNGQLTIFDQSAMEEDVPWSGCAEEIRTVVIKDGVTSICNYAFAGCINLTTMEVPNSVTAIGDYAFSGCTNLTDVYYPGTWEQWDEISLGNFNEDPAEARLHPMVGSDQLWSFDYATGQLIILDQSAMDMNEETMPWSECAEDIRTVVIKDGVTSICDYAFCWCPCLTTVEIPDSVTSIGDYAFADCDNLTDVYYSGTSEQWNNIEIKEDTGAPTGVKLHFLGEN